MTNEVVDSRRTDVEMSLEPRECGALSTRQRTSKGRAIRVMVVDDDIDALSALREFLQLQGCEVRALSNGHQALEVASAFGPELILLDLDLGDADGHAIARALRTQRATPRISLIAMSGHACEERSSALNLFDHYFTKPLDLTGLTALLAADRPPLSAFSSTADVPSHPPSRGMPATARSEHQHLRDHLPAKDLTQLSDPLLGVLAHELKQPLTAMAGYLASAKRLFGTESTDADFGQFIDELEQVFERTRSLVALMNEVELWSECPCALGTVVDTVVRMFHARPQGRKVETEVGSLNSTATPIFLDKQGMRVLVPALLDLLSLIGRQGVRALRIDGTQRPGMIRLVVTTSATKSPEAPCGELERLCKQVRDAYRTRQNIRLSLGSANASLIFDLTLPRATPVGG